MRKCLLAGFAALPLLTGGCVAKTALSLVTMPVKAVGQVADWTTTSQDEADRNAGRKARKAEERAARDARKHKGDQQSAWSDYTPPSRY